MWQLHYVQQVLIDVATVHYQTTHAACISISECRCVRSFSWFHGVIPKHEKHACSTHWPMPAKVIHADMLQVPLKAASPWPFLGPPGLNKVLKKHWNYIKNALTILYYIPECRCVRSYSWVHTEIHKNEKHACSSHWPMPSKVMLPFSISRCRVFVNPLCRLGSTRRHCCNSLSFSETQLLTSKAFGA